MNAATALLIGKLIDAALVITKALSDVGINYREVMDAQDLAEAEGRELNDAERQEFLDQAQNALDQL